MKYRELVRKLRKMGYEFRRQAKGGHEIWWHPQTRRYTTIPHHEARDIPKGTMSAILKDLGVTKEELEEL